VSEGETIPTIVQRKPNIVVDISADGILVETDRTVAMGAGPRLVPAALINTDWERLTTTGRLRNSEASHRGSFCCALFARFPDVEIATTRPLEIRIATNA
jgi:hypothetical protein